MSTIRISLLFAMPLVVLARSSGAVGSVPTITGSPLEVQSFLPNGGQVHGPARFYAVGRGSAVFFEPASVVLRTGNSSGAVLRVDFPAAPARPRLQALEPEASRVNIFVGNDPARWSSGARAYRRMRYAGVAPGADLIYHVQDGHLEYDLVLDPSADLSRAVLRYRGTRGLSIGPDGWLTIQTAAGTLAEAPPLLYQERSDGRVTVAGGYRIVSKHEIGFWAAAYDRSRPLIVDPGMMWSTFLGGSGTDCQVAVATNSSGESFLVGYTSSTDYPTTVGGYQGTKHADDDVIVTKLRSDGTMAWSTYLGGSAWDAGRAVAVDANGNVYITGETLSNDFPVTAGAFHTQIGMSGTYDAFVTKLAPNGDMLAYSTYLGGLSDDKGTAIAVNRPTDSSPSSTRPAPDSCTPPTSAPTAAPSRCGRWSSTGTMSPRSRDPPPPPTSQPHPAPSVERSRESRTHS